MTELQALHILRNAWLYLATPHTRLAETSDARQILSTAIAQSPIVLEYRYASVVKAWRASQVTR